LLEENSALTMLPSPLNIITTLLYPLHWLVIWFAKHTFYMNLHSSCNSSRHVVHKPFKCISVCGTAADVIISSLFVFPCALYEIYLCYSAIRSQKVSSAVLWSYVVFVILFFPFVYLGFLAVLFSSIINSQTMLKLDKSGKCVIDHDEKTNTRPQTLHTSLKKGQDYVCLEVCILRAEFKSKFLFNNPVVYAIFAHTEGRLVTKPASSVGERPTYFFYNEKKYFVFPVDVDVRKLVTELSIVDNDSHKTIAVVTETTTKWIVNGRFEGNLELKYPGCNTAAGSITISVKKIDLTDDIIANIIDNRVSIHKEEDLLEQQLRDENVKPVKFKESDIEEIFQGIREKDSIYPKSPYAYESHVDLKRQLSTLREELTKSIDTKVSALQQQLLDVQKELCRTIRESKLIKVSPPQEARGEQEAQSARYEVTRGAEIDNDIRRNVQTSSRSINGYEGTANSSIVRVVGDKPLRSLRSTDNGWKGGASGFSGFRKVI